MKMRIGYGYDIHVLIAGRPLILGGVEIQFVRGLKGHSDADVLCHAIGDALLGAAALGDLGHHFPDTDEKYRGISSLVLLKEIAAKVRAQDYSIVNVDAMLVAEAPKLAPYREQMRQNIAESLGVDVDLVSVKFTTAEETGIVGRGGAICCQAVAMLAQVNKAMEGASY